jgi:hypothetical protein
MKLVRFIPTSDGGSQFVDVDIPIDNAPTDVSDTFAVPRR